MKIIPASSLVVPPNRQRREFDEKKLSDLTLSIQTKGLLHPPVVRQVGEEYHLVAGERRTRAILSCHAIDMGIVCNGEFVKAGLLPVTLLGELTPLALREAELEENTIRADLTWDEEVKAIAELAALRADQAVERGVAAPTTTAIASEICGREARGGEISKVSDAVTLARHLSDPDVAKAKSTKEALKIVRQKAEQAHRTQLAAAFDAGSSRHTLHNGDSLDWLKTLPSGAFDCILTDPPYGVGADTFGDMASTGHEYQDTLEYALKCYQAVAEEGLRITKENAHCYAFLDIRYFQDISLLFSLAGWTVWPKPLIWDKGNGMLPVPDFGPRYTYEAILFATKGTKRVLKVGAPDVLRHPLVASPQHGAQKPVSLYEDLLGRSCYPGELVVDPFAGSGTIFPAANARKLTATGNELSANYYALALSRINETSDLEVPGL